MTKISVIVPVYNVKEYFEECLWSIYAQDFQDFEVILVDDGSTDGSGEFCDALEASRENLKVIHKSNGGLSSARNEGVRHATGDWLVFVDSDDIIPDNAFSNMMKYSENDIDVIIGKFQTFDSKERIFIDDKIDFTCLSIDENEHGAEYLSRIYDNVKFPLWSACRNYIRRAFWEKNKFSFKEGITSEDMELIPRVQMLAENVALCPEVIYYYRVSRGGSIMASKNLEKELCFFHVISFYEKFFFDHPEYRVVQEPLSRTFGRLIYTKVCNLSVFGKEEREEIIDALLPHKKLLYDCESAIKWRMFFKVLGARNTIKLMAWRHKK